MSHQETHALGRTAALLLLASAARFAWGAGEAPPPPPGAEILPALLEGSRAAAAEEEARARPLGPGERIDPNRASAVELDRLPGVGPALAAAIVAHRDGQGPFRSAADLVAVRGVGPALVARMEPHLDLSSPPPGAGPSTARRAARREGPGGPGSGALVDLNRADTLALQALPGVGPALARRIVEARRSAPFGSVDDLERVRGIGPATLARLRALVTVRP